MINFNVPPYVGDEITYIQDAITTGKICGDGKYTKKCNAWLEEKLGTSKALLTTSCTHALEMAAVLCKIELGDEVILPSYTFVSTGDAFVQRGARLKYVDIRPDTMNIDESKIEAAITERTKAIVPVHYAGVSCEMDVITKIAQKYNLVVVEDAAQGVLSYYKARPLGTIVDFGCYSFHETKNYSMGEGGALLIREKENIEQAEIIREKGTNRSKFFRGQVDKYTWVDYGSSYLPSELNAAYLWAQLSKSDVIMEDRMRSWNHYYTALGDLEAREKISRPYIPKECKHNAHMFYIKVRDIEERTRLIQYLKEHGVLAVFHYIPLHTSPAGKKYGDFCGKDEYTTKESERLIRLPMYYGLKEDEITYVCDLIYKFYQIVG